MKIPLLTFHIHSFCTSLSWATGILLFCLGLTAPAAGQPAWNSKKTVEGRLIFKDIKIKRIPEKNKKTPRKKIKAPPGA